MRKNSRFALPILLLACAPLLSLSTTHASPLSEEDTQLLREQVVERINEDRADAGLLPVELDELASQVAAAHCQEMLDAAYLSHWNQQGLKPYHRYSLAAGTHYIAENLYQYETTGTLDTSPDGITELLLLGHQGFMDEGPEGGHRKNILDPFHTHVGIGFAFSDNSLRMAQEFLNKYISLDEHSNDASLRQKISLQGNAPPDTQLLSVTLFYEPLPQQMSIEQLQETAEYSLPDGRKDLFPVLPPGWYYYDGGTGDVKVNNDGTFSFPVPFFADQGIYTVVVWVQTPQAESVPATSFSLFVNEE